MKKIISLCILALLFAEGCSTDSQGRHDLFASSLTGAADAAITANLIGSGEIPKGYDYAIDTLALRLNELNKLGKGASKDDVERQVALAHNILKHEIKNPEQLLQSRYSLQMVIELKTLVTNAEDIQRASDLAKYLETTSTNQILWPTPAP